MPNPTEFGVVEFDKDHNVLSIEEKPENLNLIMQYPDFIITIIA